MFFSLYIWGILILCMFLCLDSLYWGESIPFIFFRFVICYINIMIYLILFHITTSIEIWKTFAYQLIFSNIGPILYHFRPSTSLLILQCETWRLAGINSLNLKLPVMIPRKLLFILKQFEKFSCTNITWYAINFSCTNITWYKTKTFVLPFWLQCVITPLFFVYS